MIRLCMIMEEIGERSEKKKPDARVNEPGEEELPLPARSEIIREPVGSPGKPADRTSEVPDSRHIPATPKPIKSISIKEIMAEGEEPAAKPDDTDKQDLTTVDIESRERLTPESLSEAWAEFTGRLKGEGTRIVSMFKTIRPELENGQTIRIHLTNAAQKDLFVQNYKSRLIGFLDTKFIMGGVDIETIVDLSQSNDILYTDEQKYNYLVSKYPAIKEFKKAFNLDIP